MPPLQKYTYTGPADCTITPDRSQLKGKSVIITGGANGMGEMMVREFLDAGAYVTFADVNDRGKDLERELGSSSQFVKCDISNWDDQVKMFEAARSNSPAKSVDVVIANAGISRSSGDSLFELDLPDSEPTKPRLNIVNVNMVGTMYTFKLAAHYFRKQADTPDRDRCFIMTGSMTQFIDSPGNWEYTATKYGLRGLLRTARRSVWEQGMRINLIAPCWIKSAIRTAEYEAYLRSKGIEFGYQEDCAGAMMRIACDQTMNGRELMITPRSYAKQGYVDIDMDDYKEPGYMMNTQKSQLDVIQVKWVHESDPPRS